MKICAAFTSPSSSWDDVLGLFWGGLRSVTRLTALAKNCRFAATKKVTRLRRCIRIRALRRGGKLKSLPYERVCDDMAEPGGAPRLRLRVKSATRLRCLRRHRRFAAMKSVSRLRRSISARALRYEYCQPRVPSHPGACRRRSSRMAPYRRKPSAAAAQAAGSSVAPQARHTFPHRREAQCF